MGDSSGLPVEISAGGRTEFVGSLVGGEVDPVVGDVAGEHVGGGVFTFDGDVGVVAVPAAGHGDVDVADVGDAVEDGDGVVDGAALCAHRRHRVGELDVLGHIDPVTSATGRFKVPEVGLEPTRPFGQRILSRLRGVRLVIFHAIYQVFCPTCVVVGGGLCWVMSVRILDEILDGFTARHASSATSAN